MISFALINQIFGVLFESFGRIKNKMHLKFESQSLRKFNIFLLENELRCWLNGLNSKNIPYTPTNSHLISSILELNAFWISYLNYIFYSFSDIKYRNQYSLITHRLFEPEKCIWSMFPWENTQKNQCGNNLSILPTHVAYLLPVATSYVKRHVNSLN